MHHQYVRKVFEGNGGVWWFWDTFEVIEDIAEVPKKYLNMMNM